MTDDERVQTNFELPADLADEFDDMCEYGEKGEFLVDAVRMKVNGGWDARSPYDIAIRDKRRELREVESRMDFLQRERDEILRDIDTLQKKRDEQPGTEDTVEDLFDEIDTKLRTGLHFPPDHPDIVEVASTLGISAEEAHERLKSRNPDVPDKAFEPAGNINWARDPWDGFESHEMVEKPVDEREPAER